MINLQRKFIRWASSAALALPLLAIGGELPRSAPEQVDLSSQRLGMITDMLKADVASKRIPGAVLMVARRGKVAYFESVGKLDATADAPMGKDGIFRIYSMSKPITTVAAMMLVEDGRLKLDEPIALYLPEFAKMNVGVEKPDATGKPALETAPRTAAHHRAGFDAPHLGHHLRLFWPRAG